MTILKFAVPLVALLIGSWFIYDGVRAFRKGDYTTSSSGPHAGQLGPWAKLVALVGIDPRGVPMKTVHVLLGVCWIASALLFVAKPHFGWTALVVSSLCSLWYLPIGTVLAVIELGMLFTSQIRNLK
jgi:hypothetical protein